MAESLMDLKLAISGAKECQQQLSAATTSVKQMQSALKLADSEFKLSGDAAAMYTSKIQTLQAQIAAQTQAVEAAKRGLETISAAYGESSSRAMAWQAKVNNAQTALNNMQASMNDMTAKLSESSAAMSSTAGAAGNLASALSGMSGGSYSMDGLNSSLAGSQTEIQKTSDQLSELQAQVKETGGLFYNVGNLSISAANGGKMASVITKISGELTKVVKSSGETASNTDGLAGALSGGNVTASGTLGGISSIVSNFGPWGAIAGAVLDLGGAIIDKIVETNEDSTQSAREAAAPAYQGLDRHTLENLTAAMNRRQDFTADVEANIKAEVTAKVDGMRVIIDEITEDGKVNTREVGSVKKYVNDVLMADYDEAVKDLYKMRGELWKIATQGFTPEEVASYTVDTEEESILYTFFKASLTDPDVAWSRALSDAELETAATQMWLDLSAAFGSDEAMVAALKDPEQQGLVQAYLAQWLMTHFKGELTPDQANMLAANMITRLNGLMTEGFKSVNWTQGTEWITNTEGGDLFTQYVQALMGADKDAAIEAVGGMWEEVMAACTTPSEAANAIWQNSGADAAAAYSAGESSNSAQTFGAMVRWVMANLGVDETAAIGIAIEMWDNVRKAAVYGTKDGTVLTADASWIENTTAGTIFTDYVKKLLGDETDGDYAAAMANAREMWEAVVAACASPEGAGAAVTGASGAEAAAAAEAGEDSDTANAFNAMVAWVMQALPVADRNEAVQVAISMWDAIRNAAYLGIDMNGVDHTAPLTEEKTWESSSAMQEYISARMGTDFNTAIANANKYWDDLIKAVNGQTSAAEGTELRATLLEQAMAEYKKTLDEIDAVTESMAGAEGKDLEDKIAQLEALLDRAEALATRIETLTAEEMNQGQGAYNIITYGHGNYDEDDIAQAAAYMNALAEMSEQDYTNAIAEADAARWSVWGNASSTPEERAAADAAYDAAVAQAEAVYNANAVEYARMLSNMMNVILQDEADKAGLGDLSEIDLPEELTKTIVQMASTGVFDGMTVGMLSYLTGPFAEGIYNALDDYTVKYTDSEGTERSGSLGYIATHDPGASGYEVFGQKYGSVSDLPFFALASGEDQNDLLNTFWTNWADYAEIPSEFDDTDATEAMDGIGANLDNTLAASITANAEAPVAAATNVANAVVGAFRAAMQISSPSRVMQEMGGFVAEGLAEGIDANIAMVARASGRMAQTVARPVGAVAGAAGNTVNNTSTSSLFVENYYQRSDADIDYLAAAIADKNRLGRMGNGLRT